jgi:hypothetical protein
MRNIKISAAIAAILGMGIARGQSGPPTPAQAANPKVPLYMAGSSAAANVVLGSIENNVCLGSYSLFRSSPNTNFFAVSCYSSTVVDTVVLVTVWYRAEGDSAVGAIPLATGASINQLSLVNALGSNGVYTVPVYGSSAANGVQDSFSSNGSGNPSVFKAPVQVGITDVEPSALVHDNYPSAYNTSVYGHATAQQLAYLTATTLFDQVFGIFVNTNSTAFTSAERAGQGKSTGTLNLPTPTITSILQGFTVNWNAASDTNGNAVTSTSLPIVTLNLEQGAGARAATSIFFGTNVECVPDAVKIAESASGTSDYFSTGDVLAAANQTPGSITYATIDNAGSSNYPNLTLVNINGVQPSSLNAAAGEYSDWFEVTLNQGSAELSSSQMALINQLTSYLQSSNSYCLAWIVGEGCEYSSIPLAGVDILFNPTYNAAALPITSTAYTPYPATGPVYTNSFTRSGTSCNTPVNAI